MDISPYRLTILGGILVVVLSAAFMVLIGGPQIAAPYLTLISTVVVPGLFVLFRLEKNVQRQNVLHDENQEQFDALRRELHKPTLPVALHRRKRRREEA